MEGRVVGEWTVFLEQECQAAAREFGAVDLDLAGVSFVDTRGVAVLKRLGRAQVTIKNCAPLIRDLLDGGRTL